MDTESPLVFHVKHGFRLRLETDLDFTASSGRPSEVDGSENQDGHSAAQYLLAATLQQHAKVSSQSSQS